MQRMLKKLMKSIRALVNWSTLLCSVILGKVLVALLSVHLIGDRRPVPSSMPQTKLVRHVSAEL